MRKSNRILVIASLMLGGLALADRTITWRSVDAKVERVVVTTDGTKIWADICGSVVSSDGLSAPRQSCVNIELAGASKTAIQGWINGAGLTAWKNSEGL